MTVRFTHRNRFQNPTLAYGLNTTILADVTQIRCDGQILTVDIPNDRLTFDVKCVQEIERVES